MANADLRIDDGTNSPPEPGPESSLLRVIYISHGYCGPYPDLTRRPSGEIISRGGSTTIVKISASLAVKYGPHVKVTEAESLIFLEKKAPGIPAPRLHACYRMAPFDRDPDDFGSVYDTYIVMTFIKGQPLHQAWPDLSHDCKISMASQLRDYMEEVRSVTREDKFDIASVTSGPLQVSVFEYHSSQGLLANEAGSNAALVAVYENAASKGQRGALVEGALAQNKHKIVLTHGDFHGRNIMVAGDRVVGLLNWETCGWYPEYWEFAKCFKVVPWLDGWPWFISLILPPYYCQWAVYDMVTRYVW